MGTVVMLHLPEFILFIEPIVPPTLYGALGNGVQEMMLAIQLQPSNINSAAMDRSPVRGVTSTGADYIEYFEWAGGNPTNEDRRGWTVVLEGNKIRRALAGEVPFGAVSRNGTIIGDAAENFWADKFLKDDFGDYILEDYEVVEWTETKVVQDAAEVVYQIVTKEREVQATETITEDVSSIELIDGKYTKVVKTETKEVPLFDEHDLYEDGEIIGAYRVPRMTTKEVIREIPAEPVYEDVVIQEAGSRYGIRYDELAMFILGAI